MLFASRLSKPVVALLAAGALAASLGCRNSNTTGPPEAVGTSGPLVVSCSTGSSVAFVGSNPVDIIATVRRGGRGAPGETVVLSVNRGTISPSELTSDSSGSVLTFFRPPATAGTSTITVTVVDRLTGDVSTSTCAIVVVEPGNPELTVHMVTPPQAAGVNITVVYDASRVTLPIGSSIALSPFNGAQCFSISDDDGTGVATLNIACSRLQQVNGPIARLSFIHFAGPEADAQDFAITCAAFDDRGAPLSAACTGVVLQL